MSTSKVYSREADVFGIEPTITLAQAVELAEICLHVLPPMPMPKISVSSEKGFSGGTAYYHDGRIVVGTHMTPSLIVHEVAHQAAFKMYQQSMKHGREWVEVYSHLIDHTHGKDFGDELRIALAFARPIL